MLYGKKINAVPRTKTPEQALAALMRLCARAERSEEDARRLMTRWGVAPADRERVLERLRRDRFIDDARYAEAFVREKINLSGWGARKIADALHRKRIARETIERALAALDAGTARERLADLLRRKPTRKRSVLRRQPDVRQHFLPRVRRQRGGDGWDGISIRRQGRGYI